ncbi:MAG: hypothetical protein M1839_001759 [Geoglossum umbratile]|nr:MAG: hypothetical protein M1839_001759 [Geoglossum umbratile]
MPQYQKVCDIPKIVRLRALIEARYTQQDAIARVLNNILKEPIHACREPAIDPRPSTAEDNVNANGISDIDPSPEDDAKKRICAIDPRLMPEHIDFVVFKNEKGEAELAIRTTRDTKGMTNTPHKRPQHAMYEDITPLFANPVLPMLAIALADGVFKDYTTFEEGFATPPPADGSLYHLKIHKSKQNLPFFQVVSCGGPTGKLQSASSFSNRLVGLGRRAGYRESIGVHDIRKEALVKADGKLSQ